MIVLTCVCVPQPGQEEEAKAAARELVERSRDHQGLIGYLWNSDQASQNLVLVEVHENQESVLNHIALADVSRLGAVSSIEDIKLFGEPPSAAVQQKLAGFGGYKVFPTL